jgi:predicted ester cyclase
MVGNETETQKDTVRRLVSEVINQGRLEVVDELFAPPVSEIAKRLFDDFRAAFPDWREDIVQLVAEGDTVVGRFKCSGTHEGEFMGLPPTGRRFDEIDEVYFLKFRDRRIVDFWGLEDNLTRLEKLGIRPGGVA